MQLSGLLEGIKNKKKFSCQSQTLRLNFSLSAADEEKNKGKQALRYSWITLGTQEAVRKQVCGTTQK